MLPTLFIGHGHPMNALDDNRYTQSWQALAADIPRPAAILCISAHWETDGICLSADTCPPTLHDFHGFPPVLYAQRYHCPGYPALAARVADLLGEGRLASGRGLDHGTWCVLKVLYPEADLPVVALSLDRRRDAAAHLALAERLRPLRSEGVLIIASGNIVHNLQRWFTAPHDFAWAEPFDRWVSDALAAGDRSALCRWSQAPGAADAVPTPEHLLPLFYALGASHAGEPMRQTDFARDNLGDICMRSLRFG